MRVQVKKTVPALIFKKERCQTMTNKTTELVFIIDRSGSMRGLEQDTIGGFNSVIAKQKKNPGDCYVSTVLFDHLSEVVHDRVRLEDVRDMTEDDYFVRGSTALIDAIGSSVHHISNIHKYARPEDVPENTLFVIITDGMENSSTKYTSDEVKRLIEEKKKAGWEFIFIGANIDAVETARHFGIGEENAVNYHSDAKGTGIVYNSLDRAVEGARLGSPVCRTKWRKDIDSDFRSRKHKSGHR